METSNAKSTHQQYVSMLMNGYREMGGLPSLPSRPCVPEDKMILAQGRLVVEEFFELMEACGLCLVSRLFGHEVDGSNVFLEFREDCEVDLAEVAKEIADLSVVTTGMFSEFGISDEAVVYAVDQNNLAKFGPGCYLDENRKLHKPPNHPKPDIKSILLAQGWNPEVQYVAEAEIVPVPSADHDAKGLDDKTPGGGGVPPR